MIATYLTRLFSNSISTFEPDARNSILLKAVSNSELYPHIHANNGKVLGQT